jgi:hypothetical protein
MSVNSMKLGGLLNQLRFNSYNPLAGERQKMQTDGLLCRCRHTSVKIHDNNQLTIANLIQSSSSDDVFSIKNKKEVKSRMNR